MIRCKINVLAIDRTKLFQGKKGLYLDVTLIPLHGNAHGHDFMLVQDPGKEARMRGEKGAILGNGQLVGDRTAPPVAGRGPQNGPASAPPENQDEGIPF